MGMATTFVMTMASITTWLIQRFILDAFNLPFLQNVVFILVIAALVQLVEMFLQKTSPALYQALGIFPAIDHNQLRHFGAGYLGSDQWLQPNPNRCL